MVDLSRLGVGRSSLPASWTRRALAQSPPSPAYDSVCRGAPVASASGEGEAEARYNGGSRHGKEARR